MRRKTIIWTTITCLLALGLGLGFVGFPVYRKFQAFRVEDAIHGTYFPVVNAIHLYQRDHGRAPYSLDNLIPKYLKQIPSSEFADHPFYKANADGQLWELRIPSHALPQPRHYICRSNQSFTPAEEARMILQYHQTWAVFTADK